MKKNLLCCILCCLTAGFLTACSAGPGTQKLQDVKIEAEPIETPSAASKNQDASNASAENNVAAADNQQPAETQSAASSGEVRSPDAASWYGSWEIKDYQTCAVYALTQEEIEEYLTYTLAYYADSCFVNGVPVAIDNFAYRQEGTATYDTLLEDYGANLGEWWNAIPQATDVTIPSDEVFFGSHFFVADNDTIWICHDGVFFLAKRTVASS